MGRRINHGAAEWAAATLVAGVALALYARTLLPGFDLGDTASFQASIDAPLLTPRQAYPLYYAIGKLFVWLGGARGWEPAYALNVASAVCGALAAGALAACATAVAGSVVAGVFAGLLFASSYTFWSQSVIAEVYALQILCLALSLRALLSWGARPTDTRLAIFFAIYALSFGNHLSMILVAPAFALYLLAIAPRRVLRWRVAALALAMAAAGALQYAWNFAALWTAPDRPSNIVDVVRAFWFDVTKTDWREALILTIPPQQRSGRWAMYWFDLRQQFGAVGVALAVAGFGLLCWRRPRGRHAAWLLAAAGYAATTVFAFNYNVGDTHVFYLPSHAIVALAAGLAVAAICAAAARFGAWPAAIAAAICLVYPAWRTSDTWPAVDRSADRRPQALFEQLTAGLDGRRDLLAADMNWQVQNGLDYFARHHRPDLALFRSSDASPYLPFLVASNAAIGRRIVLTEDAATRVRAAYGPLFDITPDPRAFVKGLAERAAALPRGTPYVLAVLAPYREWPFEPDVLDEVALRLGGTRSPRARYNVIAGEAGGAPALVRGADRPFRSRVRLGALRLEVRMEAWLPVDTMRRAGFGHVIVNGRHAFTIERGVGLVALDGAGAPTVTAYEGGLFAPKRRWVLSSIDSR